MDNLVQSQRSFFKTVTVGHYNSLIPDCLEVIVVRGLHTSQKYENIEYWISCFVPVIVSKYLCPGYWATSTVTSTALMLIVVKKQPMMRNTPVIPRTPALCSACEFRLYTKPFFHGDPITCRQLHPKTNICIHKDFLNCAFVVMD